MTNILIEADCSVSCFIICLQNLRIFISTMYLLNLAYSLCFFKILRIRLGAQVAYRSHRFKLSSGVKSGKMNFF